MREALEAQPLLPKAATPLWALKAAIFLANGANSSLFRLIPAFYHEIGLGTWQIGVLQMLQPWSIFLGSLLWAALADATGQYKLILISTYLLGAAVICSLQWAQLWGFGAVLSLVAAGSLLLAARAGLLDAWTLQVLKQHQGQASYGQQRLWGSLGFGAFALLGGRLMDNLGSLGFFGCFGVAAVALASLVSWQMADPKVLEGAAASPDRFSLWEVGWFLGNLLVYGMHAALVDSFLLVYLASDFHASKQLMGMVLCIMCVSEVIVFRYVQFFLDRFPLTCLMSFCQVAFAVQAFLYSQLPPELPQLVLLLEPLHGLTTSFMWALSVEMGRRLAPPGCEAKMQAACAGLQKRVALGLGAVLWGTILSQALPFRSALRVCGCSMLIWATLWGAWVFKGPKELANSVP